MGAQEMLDASSRSMTSIRKHKQKSFQAFFREILVIIERLWECDWQEGLDMLSMTRRGGLAKGPFPRMGALYAQKGQLWEPLGTSLHEPLECTNKPELQSQSQSWAPLHWSLS